MSIKVIDPGNHLPGGLEGLLAQLGSGQLTVSDLGVPIHPDSVRRFCVRATERRSSICYVPEIPISSKLGLPVYPPLLSWHPYGEKKKDQWWQRSRIAARLARYVLGLRAVTPGSECETITETGPDEQVHYFARHFHQVHKTPIQVSVVVGNSCNLRCIMCPYHSPEYAPMQKTDYFKKKQSMSWEMMCQIAEECGQLHIPVKMGNIEEPLLHPRIIDFVRECRKKGVPTVHITTNGTLLDQRRGQELLNAGLTSLYVSIDAATPETYRKIRGAELAKVEENLEVFLKSRAAGKYSCLVMPSFVRNRGITAKEERIFLERWGGKTGGVIFYQLGECENGVSKLEIINPVALQKVKEAGYRWPCVSPWQEIYVLPEGGIFYCCATIFDLGYKFIESMGHFPSSSLQHLWQGESFQTLRRDLIRNTLNRWPTCQSCLTWMAHVTQTTVQGAYELTQNMVTDIYRRR